jgi:Transposase
MTSLAQRSASGAPRVASGRTVSKAAPSSSACINKADRARRTKEIAVDGVLGLDIAKTKFDVALLRTDGKVRRKSCPNTPAGFAERTAWLRRQAVAHVHAAVEATGTYSEALAEYLLDAATS